MSIFVFHINSSVSSIFFEKCSNQIFIQSNPPHFSGDHLRRAFYWDDLFSLSILEMIHFYYTCLEQSIEDPSSSIQGMGANGCERRKRVHKSWKKNLFPNKKCISIVYFACLWTGHDRSQWEKAVKSRRKWSVSKYDLCAETTENVSPAPGLPLSKLKQKGDFGSVISYAIALKNEEKG